MRRRRTAPKARTLRSRRPAFTLVELVTAAAILGVLSLAVTSAMLIAAHALDEKGDPLRSTVDAAEVLHQMTGELLLAKSFTGRDNRAIGFTVPDGNGNGSDDTIAYAWSGVAGAALTRQYNGGTAVTILDNVQSLQFTFAEVTVAKDGGLLASLLGLLQPDDIIVQGVTIKLQAGRAAALQQHVEILNRPQVP